MHIGELARSVGVNIQTIRFYERRGLLPRAKRNQAGYRCYDMADAIADFIRRNQDLGFTLDEIKQLIRSATVWSRQFLAARRKPGDYAGS